MNKLKTFTFCILLASDALLFAGEKIPENLLNEFQSADWPAVVRAKESIENMEAAAIPQLMVLLGNHSIRKLKNTGDLIYPGAERFYGHGQIVDYDIDDLSVRAGWLLEDLAFQNFGFTGVHLPDNELSGFIEFNFPDYFNNSRNRQDLERMAATEKRKLIKTLSVKKAQAWWKQESDHWSRLEALKAALQSTDEKRQVKALFYIRNGKTRCSGLNKSYYLANLESLIRELAKVDLKRVSENAKLILLDLDFEWLEMKLARQES
jgi:hypothetical protein